MSSALNSTHYERLTPQKNPEVAEIMQKHGVGRKRAYTILRQQRVAEFADETVPSTQRIRVLSVLVDHNGQSKDAKELLGLLHDASVNIDMHDVVKTLWSLQKTRYVSFREKTNPPSLYAIKVTDQGYAAYAGMHRALQTEEAVTNPANAALDAAIAEGRNVLPDATDDQAAVIENWAMTIQKEDTTGGVDLDFLPLTRSIRDRARKEALFAQAAALLEEAGEDDMALTVMARIEYSPLELEVKTILTQIGVI